jgi:dTDP-4-amino-4,6-dideoxygalactose transaminase
MNKKSIFVTQPTLAPLSEVNELLKGVWERGILTHNGPLVQQLESNVSQKLKLNSFITVANGTLAIQMAIKALEIEGEIITTPFTWVATISAIQWEKCTPVFCDIDPHTLNIDPQKIEEKITDKTVAIMPVHVFGNPCDIKSIEEIATRHGLKVIYDAAHGIGSTFDNKSVLEFGDISATSLHATKLFNTAEGGACITNNINLAEKIKRIRFFGHNSSKEIVEEGFNGKLTEIHAALGIANFKYFDLVLADRKSKYFLYLNNLKNYTTLNFQQLKFGECNFSYFPVIFDSEEKLLMIEKQLNSNQIFPRRYFYPSVNTFDALVKYSPMPIAEDISKRILCLPLYYDLSEFEILTICNLIKECI